MREEFVITGIGMVSPAGMGKDAFWNALINGKSCMREISRFDTGGKSRYAGEVAHFDLDAIFPDRRLRRAANISKYCLASAKLALDDAGLDPSTWDGKKVGLVASVTHGAINYSREFHRALVKEGAQAVSPMLFSDSVLNAPAGNVSIALNIKGAVHTMVGGVPAGLDAIGYALKVMSNNDLDVCITSGAEELDKVVFDSYARFGLLSPNQGEKDGMKPFGIDRNGFVIGEGACSLVMERKGRATARDARIYAKVHTVRTTVRATQTLFSPLAAEIIGDGELCISTGANGSVNDGTEAGILKTINDGVKKASSQKPFIGNVKSVVGESFAASSMMQTASAALSLYQGMIPPIIVDYDLMPDMEWGVFNPFAVTTEVTTAMVSSVGLGGEGALLILKRER